MGGCKVNTITDEFAHEIQEQCQNGASTSDIMFLIDNYIGKGSVTESIFSGETHTIPMADVQHYEKHWYSGDKIAQDNYRGIVVVTKHTKWNFEHDVWENGIYLPKEDADRFRKAFNVYRNELEKGTLVEFP